MSNTLETINAFSIDLIMAVYEVTTPKEVCQKASEVGVELSISEVIHYIDAKKNDKSVNLFSINMNDIFANI